jgi:hypothetical protein
MSAEGAEPLRHELTNFAEADDADGLVENFHTDELGPLPLPALQRCVGEGNAPGDGKQQSDRMLRGADDIRLRRVDHHHTGVGRGFDVDVVKADAGACDHLQLAGCRDRFGVHLGGAAHDDCIGLGQGGEQGGPVGAVDLADVEITAQQVDTGTGEFFGDEDNGFAHGWAGPPARDPRGPRVTTSTRQAATD